MKQKLEFCTDSNNNWFYGMYSVWQQGIVWPSVTQLNQ